MASILKRLTPATLNQLRAIKKAYPGVPFAKLPQHLQAVVRDLLASVVDCAANGDAQGGAPASLPQATPKLPSASSKAMLASVSHGSAQFGQPSPGNGLPPGSRPGRHAGPTNGTASTKPPAATAQSQGSAPRPLTSEAERDASSRHQPEQTLDAQRARWEQETNSILARFSADQDQVAFLKRLLRQPHQPVEKVVVSASALYTTLMDEGQGQIEYFLQRITKRFTPEEICYHLPLIEHLAHIYGEQSAKCVLSRLMPSLRAGAARGQTQDPPQSLVIGTDTRTGQEVVLTPKALAQHVSLVGSSGTGKTTLCLHLLIQLIRQGHGVALVEPHGDQTRAVLAGLPERRLNDVVYLDLTDCAALPFGLNPFQCDTPQDPTEVAKTASFVQHIFERIWNLGPHTPLLAMVLRNITRTLLENPGSSFSDIPLLLHDDLAREKLVGNVTTLQTRQFWQQYNRMSPRERRDLLSSTENKIDAFLNEPLIANILSQSQTTLDFRRIMDEGKILLVNLSPQLEEMSRLLGSILVGKLLMASFSRTDTPERDRRQFFICIDEFQRFCSSEFRTFIEEARKFHVSVITAHQSLTQLQEEHKTASTGAGSLICFRVLGDPDAKVLSRSFDATPQPFLIGEELQRAVAADPIAHLTRGHQDSRVARFAQTVLHALEQYVRTPTSPSVAYAKTWRVSYNSYDGALHLFETQVQEGRTLLNECLYRCMSEATPHLYIPMLATYLLSCSQRDGREYVFSPHIKHYNHGLLFGPFSLSTFEESARKFGQPWFVEPQHAEEYIASVAASAKNKQWMAEAVVSMLTELRYVMTALARAPILVDTGQMVPKYQLRTYSDQENAIANEISQLANFHAKVKTLSGEYSIRTHPAPTLLPEAHVDARIRHIKQRMRERGITKSAGEVLEEVRKRHERLRQRTDAPPPASTTGRPNRRRRPRPPGAHT